VVFLLINIIISSFLYGVRVKKVFLVSVLLTGYLISFTHTVYGQDAQAALIPQGDASVSYTIPPSLSEDEKYWFVKFQEGNFLIDGWQDISKAILEKTPETQYEQQKRLLAELGNKIGLEWCKANEIRAIDNDMLKDWGGQLKQTVKENPQKLESVLVAIRNEVDSLAAD